MTIPSVAIPEPNSANNSLISTTVNQLAASSTPTQLPAACVSLVSTNTNGGHPLSIISANQTPQSNMSWTTQGTPIQFATAQRPNGATICSFVPQQAIYQMPNDAATIAMPQTMLITQPPSRPPDPSGAGGGGGGTMVTTQTSQNAQLTGQTAAGSIVQIIQTPNGPAQLISSSPAGLKAPCTYTMNSGNLITSSSSVVTASSAPNTSTASTSSNNKSNKQILPKGSKAKQSTANTCTNTTSTSNSKSSFSASTKQQQQQTTTMITTSLAGSAPTMNNLSNINISNLNQPAMGAPQLMLNTGQSGGFFTSNGLFFNQPLQTMPAMGQQFIINSAPMGTAPAGSTTANKQPNQTILIPSSNNNSNQLANNQMRTVQNSAPQLIQLPNGQMILVQPPPQQTSNDTIQLAQNYNQPMLIQQPTDGQTVSYSSSNLGNLSNLNQLGNFGSLSSLGNNNFIITSQPSSFVNTTPMITTTITNSSSTTNSSTTTTTTTSKSKSRRRPPAKKDNKPTKVETPPVTPSITAANQTNKNKGTLDLGDLLKDVGIMDDLGGSPPLSPLSSQQTTTTTTTTADLLDQSATTTNLTNTTLDLNDPQQQQSTLLNSSSNSATIGGQPTMVMMPPPSGQTAMPGQTNTTSYYYNPMNQQLTGMANTAPVNTVNTMSTINQPQFKLAVAPDGSLILQTTPTFAQPMSAQQLATTQQTVQSSSLSTKFVDTSKDSCGSGSSQPSPDSTTPTLDSASTPTSCSSHSLTTSTITFATNTSTNSGGLTVSNNSSQLGSIKLADSFTVVPQPLNDDSLNRSQTNTTTSSASSKKRSRSRKKKPPPTTTDANASSTVSSISNNLSAPSGGQQLITIPIQTGLNSMNSMNSSNIMNSVIPNANSNTTVIQIAGSDGSNLIGNSSLLGNIGGLNSINGGQIKILNATGGMQSNTVNPPQFQISLNNQEFLDRLETQVKTLSAVKNPNPEQATLLQELIGLKNKMLEAKSSESGGGEGNIILTSQPLLSQPSTSPTSNLAGSNNKLTKDDVKTSSAGGTQIFTIKSLADQQGNKLSISGTSLDQTKSSLTNTPQHFIIQSTPTSTIKTMTDQSSVNSPGINSMATSANHQLQLINSDPAQTTNTFESQKMKLLTPANTSQTSMTTTTVTPQPTGTTTFQLGNQLFTMYSNKPSMVHSELSAGSVPTPTLYQVVHFQPATNTAGLIKLPDGSQLAPANSTPAAVAPANKEIASSGAPATPEKSKSKHKSISFQQQISADLSAACKPDIRTPFKNCGDACKRLLRYHVFHQSDLSDKKSDEFDKDFEVLSQYLLYKKEQMFRRFQYNILKLSMKPHSTAENILLEKSFLEQERERLKADKELAEKGDLLDLAEPPFELREKLNAMVEEELEKQGSDSKKRKVEDGTEDNELGKIRKSDLTEPPPPPPAQAEDDESEASNEEESSELNEFNKYLDNLNDINPIEGLSPLYNNSNSYNSMMQITDHQTNQSDQSHHHHSNSFQTMFDEDWNNSETGNPANGAEDAVAVESILDGDVVNQQQQQQQQPAQSSNFDHDFEDEVGTSSLTNSNGDLLFDQKSNQMGLNSENDMQMESAINSILDILVPPTNPAGTENGMSSLHNSNMVGSDGSLSSNGFNFDGASGSQVSFSQNSYLQTMPSIGSHGSHSGMAGLQSRPNTCPGHNDYGNDSVLDEAVKSIL